MPALRVARAATVRYSEVKGSMNAFDYLLITATSLGAIYGLTRGVLRMATSMVSLLGALYFASLYYPLVGGFSEQQLGLDPTVGSIIGYVAVFAIVFIAIEIMGRTIIRISRAVRIGWLDRLAGATVGAALVAVVAGVLVMVLAVVLPANASLLRDSRLAPTLLAYNELLIGYVPDDVKETYHEKRDMLVMYWLTQPREQAQPTAGESAGASAPVVTEPAARATVSP